jgi:hypothetical protein
MSLPRSTLAALAALVLPVVAHADAPPLMDERAVAALAIALSVSPAPQLGPAPAGDGDALELSATVRARAITFDEVPRVRVSLTGAGPLRVRWTTERVNLPDRIEPGVVYRDVVIKLRLESSPAQVEALLADARRMAEGVRIAKEEPSAAAAAVVVPVAAAVRPAAPAAAPVAAAPVAAPPAPAAATAPAPAAAAPALPAPAPAPAPAAAPAAER